MNMKLHSAIRSNRILHLHCENQSINKCYRLELNFKLVADFETTARCVIVYIWISQFLIR
jgi:hypothetical protein